ncbi:unnamed protein product [Hymenolepis diminuta]|uniref:Uncharacterized protein n=1 Tax=Hymenolepis diminuta TaxID=6216 RepID=A0A564YFF7_HYMDI|nr:unnamed protein product [Hymenolepis diminuta]
MLGLARNLSLSTYRSMCLTASLARRPNSGQLEDQVQRESETLSLLAKNPTVRVQFSSNLPKRLTQSLSITNESPVEVQSSVLKSLMRKENITAKVLEETGCPPLVLVEPVHGLKSSSSSHRDKLLKLRTNIDDHMMGIKVKQATELVVKGHEVSINIRLPNQQLRQINDSPTLSEEQKLVMKKAS